MKIRERLEACLARIADPGGEGSRAFLRVYAETARIVADAQDRLVAAGMSPGPLAGTIVSIKDLFNIAGEPTTAGSIALRDAAPAAKDAPAVARLRAAGAIIIGRTNMTEFAFSGIGINPHYGTPGNPADRARIPGGSSSGAAVAVADGMCDIAIGSDTGGSTRIPAALCGIVGFKPTQARIPLEGALPLSTTLDSIGPLAGSVADCARADAVMAGAEPTALGPLPVSGLRLLIPKTLVLDGLDARTAGAFERATGRLAAAKVRLSEEPVDLFAQMAEVNAAGGFAAANRSAWHRELIERSGGKYDPRVRKRIERGRDIGAADYIAMSRQRLVAEMDARLERVDALLMPTVPVVAPRIDALADDDAFMRTNALILRNTSIANFFDLCAVSLPVPDAGALPVGLMLIGRRDSDARLLRIAAAVEEVLKG